jgi:hypothetical protein
MSHRIDLDEIAVLLADLEMTPQAKRIDILKSAVINGGGRCDLPSSVPGVYEPVLMSVQVFGVYAMAEDLDELARNWMRGARNILEAAETPGEAA